MSDNICEELMVEILTRLPPKSLLRFRSVSKSLQSCIDSPDFIHLHTCRSPQRVAITHIVKPNYVEEYGDIAFCTLHAEDQLPLCRGYIGITAVKSPFRNSTIVASCNGILCLLNCEENGEIGLWNPSIMRQLALPDSPRRCVCALGIGLGFDPITDDYKVVSIPLFGGIVERTFVYALKTRNWRPITSPMPLYSIVKSRACYLNGVLHWVVERYCTNSQRVELGYIMTLDLSSHVFGMIALPKPSWETLKVTTIQGSLAVISRVSDGSWIYRASNDSWIWVRRDADASWSVIFKSKTNQIEAGLWRVLELTNGDLLLNTSRQGLQVYNPKIRSRSSLVKFNDASYLFDIDTYVESLELLHMGTSCDVYQLLLQEKEESQFSK